MPHSVLMPMRFTPGKHFWTYGSMDGGSWDLQEGGGTAGWEAHGSAWWLGLRQQGGAEGPWGLQGGRPGEGG